MLNEVSAFTRELIDEVARDHYSLRAWRTFLSQSWARSLEDIRKCPARTRSFWWWVVVVAAIGISSILLTLWPIPATRLVVYWASGNDCGFNRSMQHIG